MFEGASDLRGSEGAREEPIARRSWRASKRRGREAEEGDGRDAESEAGTRQTFGLRGFAPAAGSWTGGTWGTYLIPRVAGRRRTPSGSESTCRPRCWRGRGGTSRARTPKARGPPGRPWCSTRAPRPGSTTGARAAARARRRRPRRGRSGWRGAAGRMRWRTRRRAQCATRG